MNKNIPWELIISELKNEISEPQRASLNDWRANEKNNTLYLELASLWKEIQKDAASWHPDTEYYWKQLEEKINNRKKKEEKPAIPLYKFRIAVAVAAVFLVISVLTSYLIGIRISQPEISSQTYTALNGKSRMVLPDGSEVWLNTGSSLVYETSFLRKRTVKLNGEAMFEVKKDMKHPFVVDLDNVHIEVLGTRFNVHAYPENPNIRIALIEGKISVQTDSHELKMLPGEVVSFDKGSNLLSVENDDVIFESFWANNSCAFTARSLKDICKYLERWYNVKISLDPKIAETHVYTFTITNEPLETILQIMSKINPIHYSFEENNEVIIKHVKPLK